MTERVRSTGSVSFDDVIAKRNDADGAVPGGAYAVTRRVACRTTVAPLVRSALIFTERQAVSCPVPVLSGHEVTTAAIPDANLIAVPLLPGTDGAI